MKNVEIHNFKGELYVIDFDKLEIYRLDEKDDFAGYKATLRNPNLSNKIKKPKKWFLDMLEKHSKTYDKNKHKFKGEE